jgi:hypothetical protein
MELNAINTAIGATNVVDLGKARKSFVGSLRKTSEVLAVYAQGMSQAFDLKDNQGNVTTKWYDLKGKLKQGVNDERALFVADMTEAGYEKGTIDVYWQRVKEASGRTKPQNRVSGGVDVDAENVKNLKTMLNRIDNAEPETAPLSFKVVALLLEAADLMGIDTKGYAITGE